MGRIIILVCAIFALAALSCKKQATQTKSCTFTFVYRNYGTSTMVCVSDLQTDTIKTPSYQRSEIYSVNSDLLHGHKQVYISCTSSDSVQVFGYVNGVINATGFKNKVSKTFITYTW